MADFSGYATKNDLLCADGRVIRSGAFKHMDGQKVPLVWNHQHNDPFNVLGYAILHNATDGVRADCTFNDTAQGQNAKSLVKHGDVFGLSIYADGLKQVANSVMHGDIKEVSLVLAGANPGALIDDISFAHGEDAENEAVIYTGEGIEIADEEEEILQHSADPKEDEKEKKPMAAQKAERTVQDVIDTMTDEQKNVMYAMVGQALKDGEGSDGGDDDEDEDKDEGGESKMKHNIFEMDEMNRDQYLSHADMQAIFADAKRCGSLKEAVDAALDGGVLAHSIDTTGMTVPTSATQMVDTNGNAYGFNNPGMLFPDYKSLNNPPEWISRRMEWVSIVMNGVHHTPFSRIKSVFANITEDEARARGYIKGNLKKEEVFTTLKRTTDPQTIYKKQKLDRDDIIDITDFDVVAWIRAEMRVMLDEEIARAILIGDGRNPSSDDKIQELHIRPIATDVPLFNVKVNVTVPLTSTSEKTAKETINAVIRARKHYKGSGNPTFFTTEDALTEMLLIEDGIGHKLYKTEAELATALRVKNIVTVEVMENQQIDSKPLIGIIVNLADYNVGADKGGAISLFDDFDIDYNQQKYLIETRISGALIKPFSALTILLNKSNNANGSVAPIGG